MANWRDAADKYRQAQPDEVKAARDQQILALAQELDMFLKSGEGVLALELLKASGRHIILGEEQPEGGFTTVYFLNGDGLRKSDEAAGTWTAYASPNQIPAPKLSPITLGEAAKAALTLGRKQPGELVHWLREELDKIAAAAPEPKQR
ncbi:hypothetical protein HZC53_01955 [Candidatus Uhrbacteria bacterium]|nr:hypothetical protein [Candidatus Uhrbacteria bacterium]